MTQFAMAAIAQLGLLKLDFLGLGNLTILGEARDLVTQAYDISLDLRTIPLDDSPTFDLLSSGETTVTVQGRGRGGRNQELALAARASVGRAGPGVVLARVGSDGVEGPTDAAGAVVAVDSVDR